MNDEAENETIVLVNPEKFPTGKPHPHHGMEVICKAGEESVTIPPMFGHDEHGRYIRSEDTDEKGRTIFRADIVQ